MDPAPKRQKREEDQEARNPDGDDGQEEEAADDDAWLFRCDLGVTDAEAREAMGLEDTATVLRLDGTSWGSEGSLLTDPLEAVSKATSSSKAAGAQEPPESVRVGDREFEVPPEEEQGMGPKGHLEAQQELEQESHQLTEALKLLCEASTAIVLHTTNAPRTVQAVASFVQCLEAAYSSSADGQVFVLLEGFTLDSLQAPALWEEGTVEYPIIDAFEKPPPDEGGIGGLLTRVRAAMREEKVDRDVALDPVVLTTKEAELGEIEWEPAEDPEDETELPIEEIDRRDDAATAAQWERAIRKWDDENGDKYHYLGGGRKRLINFRRGIH